MYMCALFAVFLILSACSDEKSYDFEMGNGEIIKVTMDTGNGYNLLAEGGSIIVQKDGKDILSGLIITNDGFETNAQAIIENQNNIDIEDETEIDFLFQIENSEYAGVFMSFVTYEEARSAFDRITFR